MESQGRVLFVEDSVAGRRWEEDPDGPGHGDDRVLVHAAQPVSCHVINRAVGGDRLLALGERWERYVLAADGIHPPGHQEIPAAWLRIAAP